MNKTVLKKIAAVVFCLLAFLLAVNIFSRAADYRFEAEVLMFGPASFMPRMGVIYMEQGQFIYTNPVAMAVRHLRWLAILTGAAVPPALLAGCIIHWLKVLSKVKLRYKILVFINIAAIVTLVWSIRDFNRTNEVYKSCFDQVRQCRTLVDFEQFAGKWIYHSKVTETDRELVEKIACFNESNGFSPGRELYIFRIDMPQCYILVWQENGKVVKTNWCHQSASEKPPRRGEGV